MSKVIRWVPAVIWMGVIFWLSSQEKLPPAITGILEVEMEDKIGHFIAYAILAVLVSFAITRVRGWQKVGLVVAFAICYAITDELHQTFVPGRSFELLDIAADTLGAGFAAIAMAIIQGGLVDDRRREERETI